MTNTFTLPASPDKVFEKLAALAAWSDWYRGMKKVRIDGPARGVGALRTVWVGTTRVQEHFIAWEPGERLTFALTHSNTPGIHSMVEDWVLTPDGPGTTLSVTVGIEAAKLLRPFPGLVRAALKGPLKGAAGITSQFH
jgi:uncharacterized protein YndB with AHSA1/START domain